MSKKQQDNLSDKFGSLVKEDAFIYLCPNQYININIREKALNIFIQELFNILNQLSLDLKKDLGDSFVTSGLSKDPTSIVLSLLFSCKI